MHFQPKTFAIVKVILCIISLSVCLFSNAQNVFPLPAGNVGIGTTTPAYLLDVNGAASIGASAVNTNSTKLLIRNTFATTGKTWALSAGLNAITESSFGIYNWTDNTSTPYFNISSGGNVGIGTTSPATLLSIYKSSSSLSYGGYTAIEINNPNIAGDATSALVFRSGIVTAAGVSGAVGGVYGKAINNGSQYIWFRSFAPNYPVYIGYNQSDLVVLNGNVLIGQTSQINSAYKLDVNGTVRADQFVVNTTGADYVFDSSYKLSSLNSVDNYVKTYHHLPGIPSAKEMQDKGLRLGDNQIQLLKKMEELTLYMIEQDKTISTLKQSLQKQQQLDQTIKTLQEQMEKQQQQLDKFQQ
jgi:hypothetical protein